MYKHCLHLSFTTNQIYLFTIYITFYVFLICFHCEVCFGLENITFKSIYCVLESSIDVKLILIGNVKNFCSHQARFVQDRLAILNL